MRLEGGISKVTSSLNSKGQVMIQVVFEYEATNSGRERVSEIVKLQGQPVRVEIEKDQMDLPLKK